MHRPVSAVDHALGSASALALGAAAGVLADAVGAWKYAAPLACAIALLAWFSVRWARERGARVARGVWRAGVAVTVASAMLVGIGVVVFAPANEIGQTWHYEVTRLSDRAAARVSRMPVRFDISIAEFEPADVTYSGRGESIGPFVAMDCRRLHGMITSRTGEPEVWERWAETRASWWLRTVAPSEAAIAFTPRRHAGFGSQTCEDPGEIFADGVGRGARLLLSMDGGDVTLRGDDTVAYILGEFDAVRRAVAVRVLPDPPSPAALSLRRTARTAWFAALALTLFAAFTLAFTRLRPLPRPIATDHTPALDTPFRAPPEAAPRPLATDPFATRVARHHARTVSLAAFAIGLAVLACAWLAGPVASVYARLP